MNINDLVRVINPKKNSIAELRLDQVGVVEDIISSGDYPVYVRFANECATTGTRGMAFKAEELEVVYTS